VENQKADPDSLLNFYRALLRLRRAYSALCGGLFLPLHHEPQRVLSYIRQDNENRILVALNFARGRSKLALGGDITRHQWEVLLSSRNKNQPSIDKGWLKLEGYEVMILIQKQLER